MAAGRLISLIFAYSQLSDRNGLAGMPEQLNNVASDQFLMP